MAFLEINIQHQRNASPKPLDLTIRETDGYFVVGPPNAPYIKLRKRQAYPGTYAYTLRENAAILGYGPVDPRSDDEFLRIIIDHSGNLAIRRDVYATLPIFYGIKATLFVLSNDYSFVVNHLPLVTLNHKTALESLISHPYSHATLWEEVSILGERQVLEVKPGPTSVIHMPEPRSWQSSREAVPTDPRSFKAVFEAHLDALIDKFVTQEGFAFEVSGGVDSATLPLYFAKTHPYQRCPPLGTMIFHGSYGTTQTQKIKSLSDITLAPVSRIQINPATDYPLSHIMEQNQLQPYYHFGEIYVRAQATLAAQLARQGVRIISTGIGGDELFENTTTPERQLQYGQSERQRRQRLHRPPFLTPKMHQAYIETAADTTPYPIPLLAVSLHGSQIARNNIYIERDIWPISPYANPNLYAFCQGLPIQFRINKNILRAFYEAHGFPQAIHNPRTNEDFSTFFRDSWISGKYDQLVNRIAARSVTERLGYVDVNMLLKVYEACKHTLDNRAQSLLFHLYLWLSSEINLQAALSSGKVENIGLS